MRITNSMMTSQFLSDANSSLSRVSKTYAQVTSGKRINSISDDPLATVAALKARTRKSTLELYESNVSSATSTLKEVESAADSLNDVIQSAYESMVSANSGSKTQDELDAIAEEIANLRDEILTIGNTSIGDTYIFGGYSTADQPFTTTEDGDLLYNGINLTDLGAYEDYSNGLSEMSDLASTISDLFTQLSSSDCSDYYAQNTVCADLYSALEDFTDYGESVLSAAQQFIDMADTTDSYKNLSELVDSVSSLMAEFYTEWNQELQPTTTYVISGDDCKMTVDGSGNPVVDTQYYTDNGATLIDSSSVVYTENGEIDTEYYENLGITVVDATEYENYFHKSSITDILSNTFSFTDSTGGTISGSFSTDLGTALSALQGDLENENAASFTTIEENQETLSEEELKSVMFQVGNTQTISITYPGVSLLGDGNENLYYVLDQCVEALQAGDTDQFSSLIGNLQDRQSDVLTFETKIGAQLNRMETLTARYDTSILNYEDMRSQAEDVDEAEAITAWKTAKTVYEYALSAGASALQTSLIDFLD